MIPDTPIVNPEPAHPAKVAGGLTPPIAAGIACIFTIISGVVFLVIEKKNAFVRFWAMQAVLLGLLSIAAAILFPIAYFLLGHMPLIGGLMNMALGIVQWLFQIAWLIVYLICIVKAFTNQTWEIPWLGKIARRWLSRADGVRSGIPA